MITVCGEVGPRHAPRWRRPALVSGLMAAAFAVAGLLAARAADHLATGARGVVTRDPYT